MDHPSKIDSNCRISGISAIEPTLPVNEEKSGKEREEINFPPEFASALAKLEQRNDMAGYVFRVCTLESGEPLILLFNQEDEVIARLTPGECLELSTQCLPGGLMIEIQC